MIQFFHVYKNYLKEAAALSDVTLQIGKGEFVFVTGPSGAGKSTLLKLIFCAEQPSQGQILVNSVNVSRLTETRKALLRRKVGVVFQDFKLLGRRSVQENVSLPLEVSGLGMPEIRKRVRVVLKHLNLEHKLQSRCERLSGGEQQRAAIARAIVNDPLLVLADEPTGNLDHENAEQVMKILHDVNARGTTVVVATHDAALLERYARRVITLEHGRVLES